jgi:KUP system potassium uptake protein
MCGGVTVAPAASDFGSQRGRELVTNLRQREEGPLRPFVEQLHAMKPPLPRCAGTAVFLNRGKTTTPLAMRAT